MLRSTLKHLFLPLILASTASAQTTGTLTTDSLATNSRNVILIIGDGMDDQQITIARNYLKGAGGQLLLDNMPVRSAVQVLTVQENNPKQPMYVADSANTATSMATGKVTSRGRIGTMAYSDNDSRTIAEFAKAGGYGVGIVSTASITDATPASFISHINQRFCESPATMVDAKIMGNVFANCASDLKANGGLGSIAEQIADSPYDIILGGGQKHFEIAAEGNPQTLVEQAEANGFQVVKNKQELAQLRKRKSNNQKKILGLFAKKHLPTRLQGEGGRIAAKPKPSLLNQANWKLGTVEMPATMTCETNPKYSNSVSLKEMTAAALQHLSTKENRGFFLMVESASIDKQAHARNACGSIGEVAQLEEALQEAMAFAETHPETLILVTADHGQVAQLVPETSLFAKVGVPVYSPGRIARIKTPEGSTMVVNYATNNDFPIEEHSGVNVPLFANEIGRSEISPMIRQPDIFMIMMNHLQLTSH
jgi:alkaline phosphatase